MKCFKPRSLSALSTRGLLLALVTFAFTGCATNYYYFPTSNFAGRPVPPSKLAQRVMVSETYNGSTGSLQILDGKRDIRSNVENTTTSFSIGGYSGGYPSEIINDPAQFRGYVYSSTDGSLTTINYGTESSSGSAGSLGGLSNSIAVAQDDTRIAAAVEVGSILSIIDNTTSRSYALNLPNVYQVSMNAGNSVILAMVRNSNALYRVVKLVPNTVYNTAAGATNPLFPPTAVDCQPYVLPVYCVVPVPTAANALNEPRGAYFSLDGATAYILNCGTECGGPNPATLPGSTAGVTPISVGTLTIDVVPSTAAPSPVATQPTIPIPGGVTAAISDSTNLYLAGQQLQPDGLFAGELTVLPLDTLVPFAPLPISDGNHSKMLFADNGTLWIGSQYCATGERAQVAATELAASGFTDQAGNYNCLTNFTGVHPITGFSIASNIVTFNAANSFLPGQSVEVNGFSSTAGTTLNGHVFTVRTASATQFTVVFANGGATVAATTDTGNAINAQIVPYVVQSNIPAVIPSTVPYPNQNLAPYYYGSLTGLCWVQYFGKVYTAYGGQVHAFNTVDGSEIDNYLITIQGTALDVAYMDALTDEDD